MSLFVLSCPTCGSQNLKCDDVGMFECKGSCGSVHYYDQLKAVEVPEQVVLVP